MPATTLKVGHGNIHNGRQAVRAAVGMGCDVFGFNEAGRVGPFIRGVAKRRGYRVHAAKPTGRRNVSGDTTTLIRKRFAYLGEWQQQVSQQVDRFSRVAPDRWFNLTCFAVDDLPVAHLNVHPNAGPKALRGKPRHPITREYRESMEWLDTMLDAYRAKRYALLVTGDFNLPDMAANPEWSPWPRLKNHGLTYRLSHIDGIAWSGRHFDIKDWRVIPKETFGSDHPALRAVLEVK